MKNVRALHCYTGKVLANAQTCRTVRWPLQPPVFPIEAVTPCPSAGALALALLSLACAAHAQRPAEPASVRWQPAIAAFDAADLSARPAPGGVLFVGSSSIRMWSDLRDDFRGLPVINRGFGGSTLHDCGELVNRLVAPYAPRQVMVYAGDNDLAEGRTPQQVVESFASFVRQVRAALPGVRIGYISIKPSPARATLLARMHEANALLKAYAATLQDVDFIDIHTPMLGADGQPRAALFGPDALHLNREGYALWKSVIAPYLQPPAVTAAR